MLVLQPCIGLHMQKKHSIVRARIKTYLWRKKTWKITGTLAHQGLDFHLGPGAYAPRICCGPLGAQNSMYDNQKFCFWPFFFSKDLLAPLALTKCQTLHDMGTHMRVLCESYPMNTNMTGFRCFSKIWFSLPEPWLFNWSILRTKNYKKNSS